MHLGHTLHQDLTMEADVKEKRARFIAKSVEVRSQFAFAALPPDFEGCSNVGL